MCGGGTVTKISNCEICQKTQNVKKEIVTTKWPQATVPLQRVHIDFFYFSGKCFLIIVDSFSKYCDVKYMQNTTAENTISKLEQFFTLFGFPSELVCDNGPPFGSFKFKTYCAKYQIKLTHSPPYHPQSNGLAERAVQNIKNVLKKFCMEKESSIQEKIINYLFTYRNTPNTSTSKTPSELIFSYKPLFYFDILNNKIKTKIDYTSKYCKRKDNELSNSNLRTTFQCSNKFKVGDIVLYRTEFKQFVRWMPARVEKVLSTLTYLIKVNNYIRFVHQNQLRYSSLNDKIFIADSCTSNFKTELNNEENMKQELNKNMESKYSLKRKREDDYIDIGKVRRSKRIKKKIDRYIAYW